MIQETQKIDCPECKGEGFVADSCGGGPKVCWRCNGLGEIVAPNK